MKARIAKERMDNFNARSSKCPICHKNFRHGCDHSVKDARDRLFENYVKALAKE